ncbi:MAG: hypothetical protein PHP82_03995 [Candidatus ainarchaeum sp.]|nr:hypothetical protein [Candidatus ainarchaeum sp.]
MNKLLKKPVEGRKLPDTPDMKAWREEFEAMSKEEHLAKLKALGLDDNELAEFEEMEEKGIPIEDKLTHENKELKEKKVKLKK